ncbi:hypothetical protein P4493_05440 [Bacillus thuringiensis]|jgi:hypothetical protein|uniref:Uncharacterized protein n=3 Tax=Bacillus thuringiensis TaxID=1428 RepID=A0A0B5NKK3_BACTU|nr:MULTISPECIES: hypothetical protein [Bacillus]MEC2534841.1 hypothetical protein [Bacillus cereus]MED1153560.1 hypothetical protein [Bacillus paranthracis]OUB09150.1 hypothetical protein BK708_31930 [Bacillus thuringiensis serovar yunnanensis]AFQ29887.1 hypothetical protein BTF1_28932 [Bacillus thuringiensis HD-789]AJG73932.1 hypothetical protein BF38_5675 [Bacillus thuringiensis]
MSRASRYTDKDRFGLGVDWKEVPMWKAMKLWANNQTHVKCKLGETNYYFHGQESMADLEPEFISNGVWFIEERKNKMKEARKKKLESEEKKPLFFIYQNGFRQISLPPKQEGFRNFDIIQLTSCDDGCLITVEGNMEEVARELSTFVGYPIVEIYCDTNEITNYGYTLKGASIRKGNVGEKVIYLDF